MFTESMFSDEDQAFLDRLGARAQVRLACADASIERLRSTIASVRDLLARASGVDGQRMAELDDLLDTIWWSALAGDRDRARQLAARLAHAVRGLDLPGLIRLRVVDAAQQIRTLVALTA